MGRHGVPGEPQKPTPSEVSWGACFPGEQPGQTWGLGLEMRPAWPEGSGEEGSSGWGLAGAVRGG